MLTKAEYKARAHRLRATVKNTLGLQCKLSQAYEMTAHIEGFQNWDTLCGEASAHEATPVSKFPVERISSDDVDKFVGICTSLEQGLVVIGGKVGSGKSKLLQDSFPEILSKMKVEGFIVEGDDISAGNISLLTRKYNPAILAIDELRGEESIIQKIIENVNGGLLVIVTVYSSATEAMLEKIVPSLRSRDRVRCFEMLQRGYPSKPQDLGNPQEIVDKLLNQARLDAEREAEPRFFLRISGNDKADEQAYWELVKIGAQGFAFTVVGISKHIEQLDAKNGPYVTSWKRFYLSPHRDNDVIIDANSLMKGDSKGS